MIGEVVSHPEVSKTAPLRNARRAWPVVTVVLAAALVTACGSSQPKPAALPSASASPTPFSSPSPSPDPASDASKLVLAAYNGMWAAELKVYAQGSYDGVDVENYAQDKALAGIKTTEFYYQQHGQVTVGRPTFSPMVTGVDLGSTPHRATLKDCLDGTGYYPVNKATGQRIQQVPDSSRHPMTASAAVFEGRWVIMDATIDRTQTC